MYDTPFASAITSLLDDLLAQGDLAPDVGLSIVFYPIRSTPLSTEGGEGQAVPFTAGVGLRRTADIRKVESIDLVFQPTASCRLLHALTAL